MLNRTNQRINYFKYLSRKEFQSHKSPYYFGYGRTALKKGLELHNIPRGKKVLIPNYICDAVLEPFSQLGISVQYYPVKEDLSPDWNILKKELTEDIAAILMVHYFGIPQKIDLFVEFVKQYNFLLIEDNSHGHGGLYREQLLGTFGEIGFSSPRKSFPILNGGILYTNKQIDLNKKYTVEPVNIPKLIMRDTAGRILDNIKPLKNNLLKKADSGAEWNSQIEDWGIDKTSYDILNTYNLNSVREKRISIYKIWHKWSIQHGLIPLFSLDNISSSAPLVFPLLFKTKKERDELTSILFKNHIAYYFWPYLPKEIMAYENSGRNLYERILCLPIHLSINPEKLKQYLYINIPPVE